MKNDKTVEELLNAFNGKALTSDSENSDLSNKTTEEEKIENNQISESENSISKIIKNSCLSNELKRFSEDYKNCRQKPIDTGSKRINDMLGGGIFPGISVLGAMPATGKSTLALQIATEVARRGTPVLFFSYEMSSAFIAAKIISRTINREMSRSNISTRAILNADSGDSEWHEKLNRRIPETAKGLLEEDTLSKNLYIFDTSSDAPINTDKLLDIVDLFCAEHTGEPSPLVIIDYLQILAMLEKTGANSTQIRESNDSVIRKLTFHAHDRNLAILIISSISRAHYQKTGGKKSDKSDQPQMDVFKESGFIEYSADYALFLGPPAIDRETPENDADKMKKELRLTVLKNRYGSIGAYTDLIFYPAQDRFEEAEEESLTPDLTDGDILKEQSAERSEEQTEKRSEERNNTPKKSNNAAVPTEKTEAPASSLSVDKTDTPAQKYPERFSEDWD